MSVPEPRRRTRPALVPTLVLLGAVAGTAVSAAGACTPGVAVAAELFALADEGTDELLFERVPVRGAGTRPGAGERGEEAHPVAVSMHRDMFRARLPAHAVRLRGAARALGVSVPYCVEHRERALALVIANPAAALAPQRLSVTVARAGERRTFVGRTPALPAGGTVRVLLDADGPLRDQGGQTHVAITIGE